MASTAENELKEDLPPPHHVLPAELSLATHSLHRLSQFALLQVFHLYCAKYMLSQLLYSSGRYLDDRNTLSIELNTHPL